MEKNFHRDKREETFSRATEAGASASAGGRLTRQEASDTARPYET